MKTPTDPSPSHPALPDPMISLENKAMTVGLSREDLDSLVTARLHLEYPSLAARLTSILGTPVEAGLHLLPEGWYESIREALERAMEKALRTAVSSLRDDPETIVSHENFHKLLGMTSGAAGGFFGAPGLIVELPITTTLMLRSIAAIARSEGEQLDTLEARLACLKVFALGGRVEEDDGADGYYGVRLALSLPVASVARNIAEKGLAKKGGPALVTLIAAIASRFGTAVSQKIALQALPLIGAAGGATINVIFMQHFQDIARGHFTIRRLERKYGPETVQIAYTALADLQ